MDLTFSNQSMKSFNFFTVLRTQHRVSVVPVGATFEDDEGNEITVKKAAVGGVMSEGVFCDSAMLGWQGGAKGIAAQIPETVPIGSTPPATKPRGRQQQSESSSERAAGGEVQGLFEKKLTKEEKKKIAEEKRKAKKAAKDAAKESG